MAYCHFHPYSCHTLTVNLPFFIRRPWPSPRPGRRLGPPEVWILSFLNPCHAHTAGKRHHKATAMAQEHPTAAAMASFIGCRLRSLKPSKPSNSSKSLPNSAGKRHPAAAAMAPPQGHRNGSRAPHGRSNGFFYRLPFAKPQALQTFQLLQKFAQLRREKAPHGRSNGFFYRRSRLPFARPQTFQTLHTLDKSAQLRREKVPQQAQHAPLPHAKRPTSHASLCCSGVQACRLPGFKPLKRLKCLAGRLPA